MFVRFEVSYGTGPPVVSVRSLCTLHKNNSAQTEHTHIHTQKMMSNYCNFHFHRSNMRAYTHTHTHTLCHIISGIATRMRIHLCGPHVHHQWRIYMCIKHQPDTARAHARTVGEGPFRYGPASEVLMRRCSSPILPGAPTGRNIGGGALAHIYDITIYCPFIMRILMRIINGRARARMRGRAQRAGARALSANITSNYDGGQSTMQAGGEGRVCVCVKGAGTSLYAGHRGPNGMESRCTGGGLSPPTQCEISTNTRDE